MPANTVTCHDWHVEESTGTATSFHHRSFPEPFPPSVHIHRVEARALILGSTQDEEILDADAVRASGIEVCRRRSGGGLVGLDPHNDLWIDVLIPPSSQLWSHDIGEAFTWLGEVWAKTLRTTLTTDDPVEVHHGRPLDREAGRLVCFAGLGRGEVTVAGSKVIGLSQRRTRAGARFQCAMTWSWKPIWLGRFLNPDALRAAGLELDELTIGLPDHDNPGTDSPLPAPPLPPPSRKSVVESFLRHLPEP